jgi:hypothetical protein
MKKLLITALFVIAGTISYADGILISWGGKDLEGMTAERFEAAKLWTADEVITKLIAADNWPETYLLLVGAKRNRELLLEKLIALLNNESAVKLKLTSRLVIWERIISGDILFEGKGLQVNDDLFTVSGRANWLLRNLTGRNFGYIKPGDAKKNMDNLKTVWLNWKKGDSILNYVNPYDADDNALDEINSKEAIEAIILSLQESPAKSALIKNCLKRIYNLDELPKEKDSPANFCSPDTYSAMYLSKLSGIKESHDYNWWLSWWNENKNKLLWDRKKAGFTIKK